MRTTDTFTYVGSGRKAIKELRVEVSQLPVLAPMADERYYYQTAMFFEGELVHEMSWTNGTGLGDREHEIRSAGQAIATLVQAMVGSPLLSGYITRVLGEHATPQNMAVFAQQIATNASERVREWHTTWARGDLYTAEVTIKRDANGKTTLEQIFLMDGQEIDRTFDEIDGPISTHIEWAQRALISDGYKPR